MAILSRFRSKLGIVRSSIKEDILFFAIPGLAVFIVELRLCGNGLSGIWGIIWGIILHPQNLLQLGTGGAIGLLLFIFGLIIMCIGQITLWRNYSGTVLIREKHELVTHGIYRFSRNPMYLGLFMVTTGLPLYASSLNGLLVSLLHIPIVLNRIRMEEKLLAETFKDAYQHYKKTTKKLIPFIY